MRFFVKHFLQFPSKFEKLRERINELVEGYGEQPNIVFESTGVYSRPLDVSCKSNYSYCVLKPLEAKKQCDSLRIHKTDKSDAHQLALTHFTASRRETIGTDDLFHQLKSLSRFYSEFDDELSVIRGGMRKRL
jgi:transposase